jgi:hypothetical protein
MLLEMIHCIDGVISSGKFKRFDPAKSVIASKKPEAI